MEIIGTTGTHSGRLEGLQGHIQGDGETTRTPLHKALHFSVPQRESQDHVWSQKNRQDEQLAGVEATFGVRGAGPGLLASTPPRPGQYGGGTARKRKEESAEETADFRHAQRNGEWGSLVGLTGRTSESLPSTDDRQHRQNKQHQCHMAEPADKTADFILVQTEILGILELLLNTPSGSNGPGHHLKCGTSRSEHQVIGLLAGI